MAKGILVIEASEKSGTFYIVESALNFGKMFMRYQEVFSVFISLGTHQLIRKGAVITTSLEDCKFDKNLFNVILTRMKLVIVESPTKAKTLSGILGKDYQIKASMGHIRDLPTKGIS